LYTRVESKFWQDEKMRAVTDDARYLMLYLLTSPHRNIMGFYFLPVPYACFDLGWDEERFSKGLNELLEIQVIRYDQGSHVVLIQNYLKHNPLENPNQVKSAIDRLDEMPQTSLFREFARILGQSDKPFIKPLIEHLHERMGQPVTVTVTESVTEDKDTCAPEAAQESKCTPEGDGVEAEKVTATPGEQQVKTPLEAAGEKPNKPRPPFTSKKQEQLFDQFWQLYPRKKNKGQAERVWAKLSPNDELFASILAGLERAKASYDWQKEGGKYIPYPATWLNAKGWEDEYEPVQHTTAKVTRLPRAFETLRQYVEEGEFT